MLDNKIKKWGGVLVALSLAAGPAVAQVLIPEPNVYDTDPRDGKLSVAEQSAYRAGLNAAAAAGADKRKVSSAKFMLNTAQYDNPGKPLKVAALGANPAPSDCKGGGQGFYLRKKVTDSRVIGCTGFDAASKSASLSYSRDGIAGSESVTFDFGAAFPILNTSQLRDPRKPLTGLALTDYGLAIFVEGAGTITRGGTDKGKVSTGLLYNGSFEGNGIANLDVTGGVYMQRLLAGKGRVLGAFVNLVPKSSNIGLNATAGSFVKQGVVSHFTGSFKLDAQKVLDAGSTSLTTDDNYVWAVLKLGYFHEEKQVGPHGAQFSAGGTFAQDLLAGRRARLWEANASIFFDARNRTSIGVTWTKGTRYPTQKKVDQIKVALQFRF